jgi:hypothetical protein
MLRMAYLRLDPKGAHWFEPVREWHMTCGILQFTGEEAEQVGFTLPGGCGNYELIDHREDPRWKDCMTTRQEAFESARAEIEKDLARETRSPVQDKREIRSLRTWLDKLTVDNTEHNYSHPTQDTPVQVCIWDVGDHHHSKFYPTVREAEEELNLFLGCEPLTVQDLRDAGFFWVT